MIGTLVEAVTGDVVSDGSIWLVVGSERTIEPPGMTLLRLSHHAEGVMRVLVSDRDVKPENEIRVQDIETHGFFDMLVRPE